MANRPLNDKPFISVDNAYSIVIRKPHKKASLRFPYKIQYRDDKDREKKSCEIPLIFLMNAITLTNLKHPETKVTPEPIDIKSISCCYIMGSAVKPQYEKVVRKYLFGLYTSERDERVMPNDIDIFCLTNGTQIMSHIRSMTSWDVEMQATYSSYKVPRYASFDISYYPVSYKDFAVNCDFINHIKECGVCIMGKNLMKAKRYAIWHHNTIRDEVVCAIPKSNNLTEEDLIEDEEERISRFDLMNLRK